MSLAMVAFILALLANVTLFALLVLLTLFVRKLRPQVAPLLAMFMPSPPSTVERIAAHAPPSVDDDPRDQ